MFSTTKFNYYYVPIYTTFVGKNLTNFLKNEELIILFIALVEGIDDVYDKKIVIYRLGSPYL